MPISSRAAARSRKPARSFAGISEFRGRRFCNSAFSAALSAWARCTLATLSRKQSWPADFALARSQYEPNIEPSDTWLCNRAHLKPLEAGTMNPRRSTIVAAAFYPAVVIAGWAVISLTGIGSPRIEIAGAAHVMDRLAPSLTANVELAAAQTAAIGYAAGSNTNAATAAEFLARPVPGTTTSADEPHPVVVAALTDPAEILTPTASTAEALPQEAATPINRIELVGECQVAEACIDQFLWALYQRTPKEDTIKERELRKVTVKRKGKLRTVTRSFTKLVDADFTWKDPKAAERTGMPMMDYVIGGMDRNFKLKLFRALYAAETAGLQPGITSAFRDDYRQSIASGLKAASNRSYHGGSLRGGYGHGLAADIVSVNGATRSKRWVSTEALWKWVDANGRQFGIGRPYLDRDPPHVGPIEGQEYASRRGGAKVAVADVRKRDRHAAHVKRPAAKRPIVARSSKGRTV
jgi:hypothetical protein